MKNIGIKSKKAGFTLMEMVVSITIFTLITVVVLYNHSAFSNNILVTNLAYQVALTLREAQVYGLSSVGKEDTSGITNFKVGYGVHFDTSSEDSKKSFVFFSDVTDNKKYDGDCADSNPNECVENIPITSGNKIEKICIHLIGDPDEIKSCSDVVSELQMVDVVFKRPDTEASIYVENQETPINLVEIYVTSTQKRQKKVTVLSSGQISIGDVSSEQTP